MKKIRLLALCLALCLLFGALAGCNKESPDTPDDSQNSGTQTPTATTDISRLTSAKYVYKTDYAQLDVPVEEGETLNYVSFRCVAGNYLYLTAEIEVNPPPAVDESESPSEDIEGGTDAITPEDGEADVMPLATTDEAATVEAVTEEVVANEWYQSITRLYRLDLTTRECAAFSGYSSIEIAEGYNNGWCNINYISAGADGTLWIADSASCYAVVSDPDGQDFDGVHYDSGDYVEGPSISRIQQFSAEGEVLREKTTVSNPNTDGYQTKNLNLIDENGRLYYYDWDSNEITVEDLDGNVIKSISDLTNGYFSTFCDKPAIQEYSDDGSTLRLIDTETFEVGEPIETPYNGWIFSTSYDEAYDFYYQYNSDLYGYKQKEQVSEKIVSWIDCDVNPNELSTTYSLPDGRFLGILYGWDDDTGRQSQTLVFLEKADPSTVVPKTVLTLACMYSDWNIQNQVVAFNRSSDKYRIIINDYSQYATNEDYSAGVTKLNTEILSGQIPDILYTANLPISRYAAKGFLVDLKPYIDADPELSGEQLMTHVLDAASIDGKLYQAFAGFSIEAPIALDKVVGEYDQWTLTELKDAMTKLQPDANIFSYDVTRQYLFSQLIQRNFQAFVDWNSGTCSFDSQEFRELLELVASFPEEFDYENFDYSTVSYGAQALLEGKQLLYQTSVWSFSNYPWTMADFYGNDFSFIGYPSTTGCATSFQLNEGLCIGATCADKDGAWQFVRQLFTQEYQEENCYNLPTNAALFNEQTESLMTIEYETDGDGNYILDENGEKIVVAKAWIYDNETYEQLGTIDVLTQADIDRVLDLYERTTAVFRTDEDILDILNEATAGYFAGQTSLDEAVRVIQNRVSLYVAEQM